MNGAVVAAIRVLKKQLDHSSAPLSFGTIVIFTDGKDDNLKLFHNLEWLPSFDNPADYNLNADAGARLKMTKTMFAEIKAELRRESTPAPDALKNDLRYILGVGWTF